MTLSMPRWTVGLVFTRKKIERSGFIGLEAYAQQRGLHIIHMDVSRPLEDQGPVNLIVHKMTDIVSKMKRGDSEARKEYDRFITYCERHPETIVLDKWEHIEKVLDRKTLQDQLQQCITGKDTLFQIPRYVTLNSIKALPQAANQLSFPVMCKRRSACSSTEAHQMTIIPSPHHLRDSLQQIENYYQPDEAIIVQEFIQHDGIIVKVYVANGQIHASTRPSFINMTQNADIVHFDSQALPKQFNIESTPTSTELFSPQYQGQPVNGTTNAKQSDFRQLLLSSLTADLHSQKEANVNQSRLQSIADVLRKQLGLTFFGFDVLVESATNDYYLVDVNYFPSFKNVPGFQPMFVDILQEVLLKS